MNEIKAYEDLNKGISDIETAWKRFCRSLDIDLNINTLFEVSLHCILTNLVLN